MNCIRCKKPLPADRKTAHLECVAVLPASGSGPLPRSKRVPYGRFPTTAKGAERLSQLSERKAAVR